jgi:hypothetical protein
MTCDSFEIFQVSASTWDHLSFIYLAVVHLLEISKYLIGNINVFLRFWGWREEENARGENP